MRYGQKYIVFLFIDESLGSMDFMEIVWSLLKHAVLAISYNLVLVMNSRVIVFAFHDLCESQQLRHHYAYLGRPFFLS